MKKTESHTLKEGTRVLHRTAGMATVVRRVPHGWEIRPDQRVNKFSPETFNARGFDLTPDPETEPKLHAKYEASWPPFIDRKWAREGQQ